MSEQENLEGPFEFQCFKCDTYNNAGIKVPIKITLDASRVFARQVKNKKYQLVGRHGRHHVYKFATKEIYEHYKKSPKPRTTRKK